MKKFLILLTLAAEIFSAVGVCADDYKSLSGTEIIKDVSEFSSNTHPRILVKDDTFKKINTAYMYDEVLREWCDLQKKEADKYLATSCVEYGLNDKIRMLGSIQKSGRIIFQTAFAYRLTGEEKYAERAWRETEYFCKMWPDWNPYQMLGVGEAMFNCAICYDWLYDYLDSEQKTIIINAIKDKGWRHYYNDINGLTVSNGAAGRPNTPYKTAEEELIRSSMWRNYTRQNNWNFVINGGVITSALALCDEIPTEASEIIEIAKRDIKPALEGFAPDGAWYEGISYWAYAMEYLVNIVSSLEASCGTDYGIGDAEGLNKTGRYFFAMDGADGRFNFSDSSTDVSVSPDLLWLAHKFNEPDVALNTYKYYKLNGATGGARGILWYLNSPYRENYVINEVNDNYFRDVETVTIRSGYDENADFMGIHGGKNSDPHAHIDSGTFVIDSQGVRFAMDMGDDNYNIAGGNYVYRNSAQGHNIIVFDPKNSDYGQIFSSNSEQNAKITSFQSSRDSAFAVCDLTNSYSPEYISSYKRGIKLYDGKTRFIIQDEFKTNGEIPELYWFMHTDAEITLSEDKRSATLKKNGKTLDFKILSGLDGVFNVMEPVGLEGTKTAEYDGQEGQYSNEGIKKLAIHLEDVEGDITISVGAYYTGSDNFEVIPIENWTVGEEDEPELYEIKINGKAIPEFSADVTEYFYEASEIPVVTALGNCNITVINAPTLNSYAYVFLSNERGEKVYRIKILSKGGKPENPYNGFSDNGYKKTFDGDLLTSESFDYCDIVYDIGYVAEANGISISALTDRDITVSVSEDGHNYYNVFEGECSEELKNIATGDMAFRYLKVFSDGKIKINEVAVDMKHSGKMCDVLMAGYDKSGKLTFVSKEKIELVKNQNYSFSCQPKIGDMTVKLFVWDMEKLLPLREIESITID